MTKTAHNLINTSSSETASSPSKKVRVSGTRLGNWFRNWLQMPYFQELPKSNEGYPAVVVAANTGLPSIAACGTYIQPLLDRFLGAVVQVNGKLWIAQAIDAKPIFYGHSRASVRPTNFDINGVLCRRTWNAQHCVQKYLEQHPPTTEKTGVAHWQFIEVDESALNHPIWHSNAITPCTTTSLSCTLPDYTYPYRIDDAWVDVPSSVAQALRTIAYQEWARLQPCSQDLGFSQAWWVENGPRITYSLDTPGKRGRFAFVAKDRSLHDHSSSRIDVFALSEEDLVLALLNILEQWKQACNLAQALYIRTNQPVWFYHSDATGRGFEPFSPSAIVRSVRPQLLPATPELEPLLQTTFTRKLSPSQWANLPPQLTSAVKASLYRADPSGFLPRAMLTPNQLPLTHWRHSEHSIPLTYHQTIDLWAQKRLHAMSC